MRIIDIHLCCFSTTHPEQNSSHRVQKANVQPRLKYYHVRILVMRVREINILIYLSYTLEFSMSLTKKKRTLQQEKYCV